MITIVEYDPKWPEVFERLRALYESALHSTAILGIEHVGSTAVEGLAAKPIVDIDIVVSSQELAAATDALCSIGFEPLGEQGIVGRWAFRQPDDLPATHTYVVEERSLALRNHLAVRDALRAEPSLREQYARLKYGIASSATTMDAYVERKSKFLLSILEQAGVAEDELAEIEQANRSG
ncbi:MAG TPA: GrpB family protein [Microthrixaceae bacterium]|nr:GrpB family protein [Microthrixaceae bacterium]